MKPVISVTAFLLAAVCVHTASAASPLTVEEVVRRALEHSDQIAAARATEQGSRQQEVGARADRLPRLDLSYGYTRFSETPIAKTGNGVMETSHDGLHKWQLTVTQPLFTGFALESNQEIAAQDTRALSAQTDRTRQATAATTSMTYNQVLLAEELGKVAQDAVESLSAHVNNARQFFEQGLTPHNEVLKSEVALAEAVQEKVRADAALKLARTRLALLADLDEGFTLQRPVGADAPGAPDPGYEALVHEAYTERPEFRAREAVDDRLAAQERAARGGYLPTVSLLGGYERTGDDISASNNDHANDHNSWVAVNVQANLFNWGKTGSRVQQVRSARVAETARTRQLRKDIAVEVKEAQLNAQVSRANIQTARSALEQARENSRITALQYEQQVATSADVLDARTFLTQAETNYLAAFYGYLDALTMLDFAVGRRAGNS